MNLDMIDRKIINVEEGVSRFSGYDSLYIKYLNKFLENNTFEEFVEAYDKKDYAEAFKAIHNVKGNTGNLSMTLLYNSACNMTEAIRNDIMPNADELKEKFVKDYETTINEIKKAE